MQLLQDGNLNAKWLSQFGTSQSYSLLQKQTPVICKSWPICWRVTAVSLETGCLPPQLEQ